jgi:polysaccharide export outer membrane protein
VIVIRRDPVGNIERHTVSLRGLEDGRESLLLLAPRGGDTVFVPEADQFYIYGAVHAPNRYRLEPDMTVLQAIALSGGLTDLATKRRMEVKRQTADGETVTERIELTDRVRADDVIYVKERFF